MTQKSETKNALKTAEKKAQKILDANVLTVWPITNFFVIEGLLRYKNQSPLAKELAQTLIDSTLKMITQYRFYEYYDPLRGKGEQFDESNPPTFGFADFSWSSAIFISLYERFRK